MKGSFEFAFIMTFVMMFLVLGLGLIRIMVQFQDAKMVQERVIAHLEVLDDYEPQTLSQLTTEYACLRCELSYNFDAFNRIVVTVVFPIQLPVIDWEIRTRITAKTIPLF